MQGQGPSLQGPGQGLHYLLQVAAKPTIAIKQQQWTQSESSQHDCKTYFTKSVNHNQYNRMRVAC